MQISATLVKGKARINFQENSRVCIPISLSNQQKNRFNPGRDNMFSNRAIVERDLVLLQKIHKDTVPKFTLDASQQNSYCWVKDAGG